MKQELEWYKSSVDLVQIMKHFGFHFTKKSSSNNTRLKRIKENGEKDLYIVKRNSQDHFTYWSPYEEHVKGSTIIDFIGNELGTKNISDICRFVDDVLKGTPPLSSKTISSKTNENNFDQILCYAKILTRSDYLVHRGIDELTALQSPFKNVLKNFQFPGSSISTNVAAILYNEDGVCGLNVRNEDYSRNYGNRESGVFLTGKTKDQNKLDTFFLMESFEDALAHFELFSEDLVNMNIRYGATSGSLTSLQIQTLDRVFRTHQPEKICLGFDKDIAGLLYALKFLCQTTFGLTDDFKINDHIIKVLKETSGCTFSFTPDTQIYDLDHFFNRLETIVSSLNYKSALYVGHQALFEISVSNEEISLSFEKNKFSLTKLFDLILELKFEHDSPFELKLSQLKDFNEDLQAKKGIHSQWKLVQNADELVLERS